MECKFPKAIRQSAKQSAIATAVKLRFATASTSKILKPAVLFGHKGRAGK